MIMTMDMFVIVIVMLMIVFVTSRHGGRIAPHRQQTDEHHTRATR